MKRAPTRTIEQWKMVGARIYNMWEEQLVDPPIECIKNWKKQTKYKVGRF